jgi:hypothetical protein
MTPQEKAFNLYYKYIREVIADNDKAKQCALIAVGELLSETEERDGMRVINNPYWLEVRNEIEKL